MQSYKLSAAHIAALAFAMLVMSATTAHAHKVNIFAYAEGGKVHTESYFADGGRAADCRVSVEDMSGRALLEGTTDKDGIFVFDIPKAEDLRVVLHAGMGHMNDYVVKASELKAAMPGAAASVKKPERQETAAVSGSRSNQQAKTADSAAVVMAPGAGGETSPTAAEIRAIVDETVEARLRPLYGMLADMKEASDKPSITDVIGGIGYIMGIMGIILYFRSRKA